VIKKILLLIVALAMSCHPCVWAAPVNDTDTISLNGDWQMGFSRIYAQTVQVPGLANDPSVMSDEVLWYKKEIKLPNGRLLHIFRVIR
jgi:hypothetical protein